MKYLKFFLINVVVFGVFFFLLSLLFPSTVHTSKAINIAAEKKQILQKLNDTSGWKTWNEFIKGNDVKAEWVKNQGDSIVFTNFTNSAGKKMEAVFGIVNSESDSTALNFQLVQRIKWYKPWEKFATLLSEKKFGLPMEMSLANFKKEIEAADDIKPAN